MNLPSLLDDNADATLMANAHRCPEPSRESLLDYLRHGIPPGSFLLAVLTNDLLEAVRRADDRNKPLIAEYVVFLWAYAPWNAWTSPELVRAWIDRGMELRRWVVA